MGIAYYLREWIDFRKDILEFQFVRAVARRFMNEELGTSAYAFAPKTIGNVIILLHMFFNKRMSVDDRASVLIHEYAHAISMIRLFSGERKAYELQWKKRSDICWIYPHTTNQEYFDAVYGYMEQFYDRNDLRNVPVKKYRYNFTCPCEEGFPW